jgi:signal transduction histidine kinase
MRNERAYDLLSNSRFALILGFGSLIVIMALAGIDALRVLRDYRVNDDRIRRQFLLRNHALNDIRSDVYLSGTYVRDYLLEPEPEQAERYRANLEQLRQRIDAALSAYGPEHDFAALKTELARYWEILEPVFKWNASERRQSGYAFLRDDVFPRRQSMLAIADRIAALNEEQLNATNQELIGLLVGFQTRLTITLFAAIAVGLGMATFTMSRILGLERNAQDRYEEVAEARTQLKDLSARIVEAQETERRALSRELHDEVGQSLSAVLVELRTLSTLRGPDQVREHLDTTRRLVEDTIGVVRNMALLLRPSMLDDLGLIAALKWQAREVSKRTPMEVSVAADLDSDDLPDEYKTCIYRVVQEALHNCASHSAASMVRIRVHQELDHLALSIQDDGRGFSPDQVKGLGLLGIQERVTNLGGSCRIHSTPGSGTIISIELPVAKQGQRETDTNLASGRS